MSDTDVRWRAKKVIQDQSNRLVTDTQIKRWDSKTDPGHTHTKTDITDFPSSMPASDVKAWAKADNKPSYVWNEIGNKPTEFNPSSHKHLKNDITDFPESIKNPLSMSIMLNGGNTEGKDLFTYDGSVAKTVNINYSNIGAAPKEHYHDDRYYTEEETDKLIKGVSTGVFENLTWEKILNKPTVFTPANHTHSKSEINDFPDSLKNPSSITIKLNGGTIEGNNVFTYDGSIAKTIDITAADIGASSIGHLHTVKDIKDFPISMPASDVYDWAKEKFKPSYVWNEIGEKPTEFNPIAHKHVVNEITDFPETMRNPYSISIRLNNGTTEDLDLFTYNGDGEKSINITPIKIDAADRVHTHTRSQITDFPETLRNPAFLTVKFDNMANKSVTSDSYDGSVPKTITVASNIHKHLKEDILDFPDSIKNPKNITLILDNGETTTQDFYDGSEAKTFNVASAKHTHSKIDFTDFPVSIKNPFSVTIVTNDGKTTSSDSYDGSIAKTFNLASAKHVHVKSEITDFPDSIKNPSAITIVTNNGETTSKDTYDGSLSKTFELASAKHVHVKSEITDFPSSIKNPTAITITMNDGTDITKDSYDGSEEKTFDVAKGKHVHVKSEITDFPDSIKNPTAITIITNDGKDISQDSYDGSEGKIFEVADAKHVHVKSEITDFPDSIKNPTAITISLNDGKTTVSDSYDGSKEKSFNAASAKHVHVKSEITDFPTSIKNPASITIAVDDGVTKTQDSYDGSSAKKFDVANAKHVHVKSEITDFPTSIKNPNTLIVNINDGKTSTQTKYDGSVIAKINVASAKHVHVKSEITDFPESIKNPTAITISTYNGTDTVSDSYDGSTTKTFNVASANHTHSKFNIVDFPDSIKNPTTLIINMNDGKNITTDSYDGSEEKTLNLASAKHVHVKSEITDFPASIKNPTAITITMNDGKTIVSDSYDGSSAKKFDVAKGKHVHIKSEITDFPASIKNPTAITITMNDGKNTTTDSYDGSSAKTFDVAKGKHVHVKSEITDFPTSIKNPTSITISLNDGKNTTTDSYDGSKEKTFNAASAKHVHVKSEITDFPSSIKNPTAITISLNDGKNITKDSYDGSTAKSFDVAKGKHVHVKSEITDFPSSIKNPTSLSIQLNGGAATVYDGSSAKSINITPAGIGASPNTHLHDDRYYTESEIDTKLSNVNTTLTSHNHTELAGVASSQAVPGKSKDGFMTYHYNVNNGLTNNMPSSNNANAILTISRHAGDYTTQLGFSSDDNIYYRNGVGTTSWKRILDSSNYNNYAPSKTGSGASGTWSINISGKANTAGIADSANAVTWGNVSGKPSTYTPSAHTHTKSQITDFPASLKNPTSLSIQLNGGAATVYDGSTAKSINITPAGIGASASGHTHNYAGSSSVGGSANSAVKLDTSTAGSATQPVYFSGGKPVACTYSLNKSVPSNAVFTDTNTWRGIQNNLTSDSTSDSLSAAQGKVLKGLIDGKASSSHTHSYLPLSGGNVTGRITRSSGGAWISQRDLAIVYQSFTDSSSACPVVAFKTKSGAWAMGSLAGTDNLYFSYSTDSDYNAGNNNANMISLPAKTGTIALTSDIPTWNTIKPYTAFFGGIDLDTNGAYVYGENNSGNIFFRYKASAGATDYSWANLNDIVNNAYGNLRLSGGTMTGPITLGSSGSIYTGNDGNYGPGSPLNNVVISSWFGVSFTTSCPNQGCTGKTAVGIDCRTGTLKAYDFAISHFCGDDIQSIDSCSIRFTSLTNWGIIKGPNSLRFANVNGVKFRMQDRYCYCDVGFVSMGIWNSSATQAANMYINDQGFIYHTSSASRYKMNIENLTKPNDYSYNILKLNPKQWFDRGETERYAKYLTAEYTKEELDDEFKQLCLSSNITPCYGLIAEDVKEAGLEEFCEFSKDENGNKKIEGVQYDRLPILMIPILRDLVSCMNKILPYAKKGIDDENILKEVEEIEKRFNSFNENDVVNLKYDPETSKIIE